MPRHVSGALVLPLGGPVEGTSEPSCPTPVRQASSTCFACLQRYCHSRVLLHRGVVPTIASSARLLQGHGLFARAAFLESLLASVPPQLLVLPERGWVLLLCEFPHLPAPLPHVEQGHLSQG